MSTTTTKPTELTVVNGKTCGCCCCPGCGCDSCTCCENCAKATTTDSCC